MFDQTSIHSSQKPSYRDRYKYLVSGHEEIYFVKEHSDSKNKYSEEDIIKTLELLVDKIFVVFAGKVYQQTVGIPTGTNCALFSPTSFCIHTKRVSYSVCTQRGKTVDISVQPHLQAHGWCICNKKARIRTFSGPDVSCGTWDQLHHTEHHFCFLPRFTTVDWEGWDFNNHITNVSFLSSNIPSSPAYGEFISQLIRYARACSSYECFILGAWQLSIKLLKQGYIVEHLTSSFRKFYSRYKGLIQQYEVSLSRILNYILTLDQQILPNRSGFITLIPSLTFMRIMSFSVLKMIEIVILWVYFTIPFGSSLFRQFLGITFQNHWRRFSTRNAHKVHIVY